MKKAFLVVGVLLVVIGVLTPLTTALVTFLLPETFASSARIAHTVNTPMPSAVSVGKITSDASLAGVITNLNLAAEWGRKYKQPGELSAKKCNEILKRMIQINLPRNTPVVEIKVFSENSVEAASIANNLAAVYLGATQGANLIESAIPDGRPVRPNKRLNISLGIFAGVTLLVVGLGLLVASRIATKRRSDLR